MKVLPGSVLGTIKASAYLASFTWLPSETPPSNMVAEDESFSIGMMGAQGIWSMMSSS